MQNVRMLMLAPVVGYGGREVTTRFAPKRRSLGVKAQKYCVCCLPTGLSKPVEPKLDKESLCTCTEVGGTLKICNLCKQEEEEEADADAEDGHVQRAADAAKDKDKERRQDTDGEWYTRDEFLDMHTNNRKDRSKAAKDLGVRAWLAAKKAPATMRWFMQGTDAVPLDGSEMGKIIRACDEASELGKARAAIAPPDCLTPLLT